ncbi:MAG: endolytic transglycosylase MltG [Gaiellaceae bacterium MAG52_C11]|nr:endolytic transglycosylase MltG [Candidatus Gaiellasilicea maunaloa]
MTPSPGRTYRSRPSRVRVALRRLVAAGLLAAFFGVALWLGVGALGSGGGEEEVVVPTTTAVPPPPSLKIVFPEGFTRDQMIARVGAVRNIAQRKRKITPKLSGPTYARASKAAKVPGQFRGDAKGIEGFLFPATYEFAARTTAKKLVADQLEFFNQNWAKLDLRAAKSKNLTAYDVLIIASMVERETIAPVERSKVAAVIYNRLKAGMPLGIDATIRYGLDVPGTEALRVSQLESDNPYNTRNRTGLPPTPIANPGLASMRAAAKPADVDFLFFVRMPDKVHHFFTASESEFFAKACEYGFGCG